MENMSYRANIGRAKTGKFDAMEVTEDIAKGWLDTLQGMFNNIPPNIDEYNACETAALEGSYNMGRQDVHNIRQ